MTKITQSTITSAMQAPRQTSHTSFRHMSPLITRTPTMIQLLNLIKLLIRSQKRQKQPGYGGQQILRRMDETESLTSSASRLTFPVQSGKRSHTTNLWRLRYYLRIRSKTSSKPITILWIQTLMMILEPWSSYNHKQFPLITNSPFKDKPGNLQIIYTSRLGMNGTWLGSFIWISFSLYILTESANYMATSEYSQSSLKISTSKRLCAMTVIEELDLRKEENPLYWTVNHLLKADTSWQPQLEYNTYLGKLILII